MSATLVYNPSIETCIQVCNSLLRGEHAAVETYDQAIERYVGHPESVTLIRMRDEHRCNAGKLRKCVIDLGGEPADGSGAWGVVARSVTTFVGWFGERPAIAALQEGEAYGIGEYEAALDHPDVTPDCKSMIYTELLPRLREHLRDLHAIAA
ncbi:MAG: DUF2383 domain-containing protein [Verrucomicrobiae bacterium]|nr:DUF2383 domain-containing protein [Verrucomicrobiae bacterium]